jgi:hypothetical protein
VEETVSDARADIVSGTEAYDSFGSSETKLRKALFLRPFLD